MTYMHIVQTYAKLNRETIAGLILASLGLQVNIPIHAFHTVHNYIDFPMME